MEQADVLIIGAGMAGMCAAISAAREGEHPVLLEALDQPGKKLLATGNGRCNLLNRNTPRFYGDSEFACRVLGKDPAEELEIFWKELGLRIRYDAEGRGYPCTFAAASVLDVLKAGMKRGCVEILTRTAAKEIRRTNGLYEIETNRDFVFRAQRLILATGGASQPRLGGNQSVWPWLKKQGHQLIHERPALTPIQTDTRSVSGLSGIRVKCRVSVQTGKNTVHSEIGELLFTDTGVSGICVMQCARFIEERRSTLLLDFFPDLFEDVETAFQDLRERQKRWPDEEPVDLLRGLLVPRLAYAVCKQAGLALRGEKNGDLSEMQLRSVAETVKRYQLQAESIEGFERAQVMSGGVSCRDIREENLESRICKGLHITGELLNADGDCGGFNLMFASMTGIKAGRNSHAVSVRE